jgi:hypothetical protein
MTLFPSQALEKALGLFGKLTLHQKMHFISRLQLLFAFEDE